MNRRSRSGKERTKEGSPSATLKAPLVRARSLSPRAPSTSAQPRAKKSNRRRSAGEDTARTRLDGRLATRGLLGSLRRHRHLYVFALLGLGLAALIVVVSRQTRSHLEESEMFRYEDLEIIGAKRATAAELESLLGVERGDNLIAIDTAELERAVLQHPWVRRVHIERGLPKKLVVEVEEHEPVALVALGHLYYADAEWTLVKRRSVEERELLPVVTGFSRALVESADSATIENLRRAVGFPRLFAETMGPAAPELDEVHFDEVMGLSFVTRGENVRVRLGPAPWESQIKRFGVVRTALRERGLEAAEVTLGGGRRPERVAVKLARAAG